MRLIFRGGWLPLLLLACGGEGEKPPNLLLVTVDTLRWDHVGAYGYSRDTTPGLDALAERSLRYERAYATSPWTLPTVASILTGLYPSRHGTETLSSRLSQEADTLAERLSREGYLTAGVVGNRIVGRGTDLDQGFGEFEVRYGETHASPNSEALLLAAQEQLAALAGQEAPFFLWVHFMDPHYPYVPFEGASFADPSAGRLAGGEDISDLRAMSASLTGEEVDFLKALYDEEIRRVDTAFSGLLSALEERDVAGNTVVAFTSDHGEEFMSHGWLGHTRTLYEELIRVPLVLHVPGQSPGVVNRPVSLVELPATLLSLAGVEAPGLQGGVMPLLDDSSQAPVIYAEVDFVPQSARFADKAAHKKTVIHGRWKLIRDSVTEVVELYAVDTDPQESRNLAAEQPELVAEMTVLLEAAVVRAADGEVLEGSRVLEAGDLEALRALGYVE